MIKVIRKEDLNTSFWSGGTTTELYIYPETGSYQARAFDFRVSTATVAVETSTFTSLPGINRLIMSLDDVLVLHHKDQYEIILKPFDVDRFKGDWETMSEGKVTDFNVMFTDDYDADMYLGKSQEIKQKNIMILYAHEDDFIIKNAYESYNIPKGCLLVSDEAHYWRLNDMTNYIHVEIKKP